MNADDFAQAVFDRLPKERPADGRALLDMLFDFGGPTARALHDLPASEVDETEKAVCFEGRKQT
jgi:hypothetical protein